jgi:hypothetical protein
MGYYGTDSLRIGGAIGASRKIDGAIDYHGNTDSCRIGERWMIMAMPCLI